MLCRHANICIDMAKAADKSLLPGYRASLSNPKSRERYDEKIRAINGKDPYEIPLKEWKDDVDLCPAIMYINLGFYLIHSASPYTGEDL